MPATFVQIRHTLMTSDHPPSAELELYGRFKGIQEKKGFSQSALARESGVPQKTISRLRNGLSSPNLNTLEKLGQALGYQIGFRLISIHSSLPQSADAVVAEVVASPVQQALSQQVRALQTEKGWSQSELARQSGVPQKTISRMEHELSDPTIQTFDKLFRAMGVYLVFDWIKCAA